MNEPHDSFLTQEKFEELKKELDHLKTVRRKEVAESLEYARSLGDISENAEYQEARDMQAAIEERIQYLEKVSEQTGSCLIRYERRRIQARFDLSASRPYELDPSFPLRK